LNKFSKIWILGFFATVIPGENYRPLAMLVVELRSGEEIYLQSDDLTMVKSLPFAHDYEDVLVVTFNADIDVGCMLTLGWDLPENVIDLFAEFRHQKNGLREIDSYKFGDALLAYGVDRTFHGDRVFTQALTSAMEQLTSEQSIDRYLSDLTALYLVMVDNLESERALFNGDYMKTVALIEFTGIPIDVENLKKLVNNWDAIKTDLVSTIDAEYGVYDGLTFKADKFEKWLKGRAISWPLLDSGRLSLEDDTFYMMEKQHPEISLLHELRSILSKMRQIKLAVGNDGRNRCPLMPFRSKTGRNQPRSSKSIFGPSAWVRHLIKPPQGHSVAYIDFCQEEFAIAGVLSNDANMLEDYISGDPYMEFAKQAGAVLRDANKESHPVERAIYKECSLAVLYGMGVVGLSQRIGRSEADARQLLYDHKSIYRDFWMWLDGIFNQAYLERLLSTKTGWKFHVSDDPNPRTLQNFLIQSTGSEILRTACVLMADTHLKVCMTVHDALLIEAKTENIGADVALAQTVMRQAGELILNGFQLRTDVEVFSYPDRYVDSRGNNMWELMQKYIV